MAQKIIIDVDTGTDDALAIFYALNSSNVEILGITTGTGNVNVKQSTENTLRLLSLKREWNDIVISPGAENPIEGTYEGDHTLFHGNNGIANIKIQTISKNISKQKACDFIIDKSKKYAGQLEIICLGRLTNLALALKKDVSITDKIKKVTIMGGAFKVPGNVTKYAESNIYGDAVAAEIVINSNVKKYFVGLDVTRNVLIYPDHFDRLKHLIVNNPLCSVITELIEFRMKAYKSKNGLLATTLHDPLAMAIALSPELARFKNDFIGVNTLPHSEKKGQIYISDKDSDGNEAYFAINVNSQKFIDYFIKTLAVI